MKTNSFVSTRVSIPSVKLHSVLFTNKWFILFLVVFAAGCKKVTEEKGLTGLCPIVISTDPANLAMGVNLNKTINATFNEIMNPLTITATTFTLKNGTTAIAGVVTYSGMTATFSPSTNLLPNTTYTGTLSKGLKDPAGNAM